MKEDNHMETLTIKEIAHAVKGTILTGDENMQITNISTNSKKMEENTLFIPIIGEKVDAHDFIPDAIEHGARACFTSRHKEVTKDRNSSFVYIHVQDTVEALQALGTYYRSKFRIPVIGITGSVGKTTTKEMVAAALETKYKVLKTEGNMNSQVGLPLMMLRLDSSYDIAVIEMGMSEFGEMSKLSKIAQPEAAVVTNIGVSHIGQLKTRENIRKEKLNIINSFHQDSVLYVNGNDDLLSEVYTASKAFNHGNAGENTSVEKDKEYSQNSVTIDLSPDSLQKFYQSKVIGFGTAETCDYRAENIRTIEGKTYFTLRKTNREYIKYTTDHGQEDTIDNDNTSTGQNHLDGDGEEIVLQVLGIHNVYNALVALAVGEQYHIPVNLAKKGLYNYQPIAMRGQIKEVKQIRIIDDSYNASPDSMKSGIQVLLELEGISRRIAVLADILELGELSYQCHYEVGVYIAEQKIDEVVTIGKEAEFIAKGIQDKNKNIITHSFSSNQEAIRYLKEHLKAGDGVLVKGSRSMRTDEIVKAILEEQ
jgi:UDP-N-acetylmuramoyl-tripeptide--D-alanyl-D-alanine ligase